MTTTFPMVEGALARAPAVHVMVVAVTFVTLQAVPRSVAVAPAWKPVPVMVMVRPPEVLAQMLRVAQEQQVEALVEREGVSASGAALGGRGRQLGVGLGLGSIHSHVVLTPGLPAARSQSPRRRLGCQ